MRWILPLLVALAAAPAAHARKGDGYTIVLYENGSTTSFGMGDSADFRAAARHRQGKAPMLYARHGGAAYVIRDAAALARARAIIAPQLDLGRRQGRLGDQQGALGHQQGKLGAQQGQLGARMANATPATTRELGRLQSKLGTAQSALGKQQSILGAKQAELGRQQAREAAIAEPKLRALVEDAVRRGIAQRVD